MPFDLKFRTDDVTKWGIGEGHNLGAAEVDINFWNLAAAIQNIIDNPVEGRGIHSVEVSGATITFIMTDGTSYGPIELPVLAWRWRGEWLPGVAYSLLDTFSVAESGIYLVLIDHISEPSFDPLYEISALPVYQQLIGIDVLGSLTYDVGFFHIGRVPGGNSPAKILFRYVMPRTVDFVPSVGGQAYVETAFAAPANLAIQRNGVDVGTIAFAAGSAVASQVTFTASTQFVAGDRLTILEPEDQDIAASDLCVTLVGSRVI